MALAIVLVVACVRGTFLTVAIARLPERRSLLAPRSACPVCGAPIAWYDNVPLVSFVVLRGRCRACAAPIPWRYPLVEATTAVLLAGAWVEFGPTAEFAVAAALVATYLASPVIDRRH